MTSGEQPCPNTYWLPGGKLAAGPYPFDAEAIRLLLDAGIRGFIDLTQEGELESYETLLAEEAAERGIEISYARFPIRDGRAPDQKDVMRGILDSITEAHAADRLTYVHCWGGIGRTGTVAACWLVEQGYSNDEALEVVQSLYDKYRRPSAQFPRSPETDAQHRFVREWARRSSDSV